MSSERARLEAIVYGRDAAVDDAARTAAAERLAELVAAERSAAQPPTTAPSSGPTIGLEEASPSTTERPRPSWRRQLLVAVAAVALVVVAIGVVRVTVYGWQPFGSTDPLAIFDRPQSGRDFDFPQDNLGPGLHAESVRYVGSDDDADVYLYQVEFDSTEPLVCMSVVQGGDSRGNRCVTTEQFSSGTPLRVTRDETWTELRWESGSGLSVASGVVESGEPGLAVFDEEQDDADRAALLYLPDVPAGDQDTVRYLGTSTGYHLAAFRAADETVCLAAYDADTTVGTSESVCIGEDQFDLDGIRLMYPSDEPVIQVSWGPDQPVTVSGR